MSSQSKTLFSYETLVHALAGAAGSVVGMSAFYPLDILRSRIQVEDSSKSKLKGSSWDLLVRLADEEGVASLYRGIVPVLQSLCASNFVYFYAFHALRSLRAGASSPLHDLLCGSVAGCVNVLATTPLWVVNTRMKLQDHRYSSLAAGVVGVASEEGVVALWAGSLPSLLLVSNPALQFMMYEMLKKHFEQRGQFTALVAFLTGAAAKAFATVLTYPLQMIQARLRVGAGVAPLMRAARRSPRAMFRGLEAKLLQTVLTAALMFATYEKIARFVISLLKSNPQSCS